MSKKSQLGNGKPTKPNAKGGGFKPPAARGVPMSRRPPRQPGR